MTTRASARPDLRSGVLAGVLIFASAVAAIVALHDSPWVFRWGNNIHWYGHWAGIAALVAILHVILAAIDQPAERRVPVMAWASIPLAASVSMSALPEPIGLLPALTLLGIYIGWLLRSAKRRRMGRRGPR